MTTLPETIGRYDVVAHLAAGGMAEIFLGKLLGPSGFERPVVIKRVLPNLSRRQSFLDMFMDEARVVSRINHPNVVAVHELGRDEHGLFMVMEYLEGESVLSLLKRCSRTDSPLEHSLAAYIAEQACAGLHAAHELRGEDGAPLELVHRDISPANIFVTFDGAVKVLDFGIAKFRERETETEAGLLKGKFAYMSPEQCEQREGIDRRSDVFALGILLFEMSTGRRLFARETSLATMRAITEEDIPSLSKKRDYPETLATICDRALARLPDERYATAAEMRAELARATRVLAPDDVMEMALAERMHALFPDRIEAKADMLRRVREGDRLTHVPDVDVDVSVELPTAFSTTGGTPLAAGPSRRRSPLPLVGVAVLIALLAAGVTTAVVISGSGDSRARAAAPITPAAPAAPANAPESTAGAEPTPEPAPVPEPGPVTLSLTSRPSGARVSVDGEPRGETPLELQLAHGEAPVSVELTRRGYATYETEFEPSRDGAIEAALRRSRGPRRGASSNSAPPSGASSDPFRRFN